MQSCKSTPLFHSGSNTRQKFIVVKVIIVLNSDEIVEVAAGKNL